MNDRRTGVMYVALSVAAAVVVTWPLVTVFTTKICGDMGDPFAERLQFRRGFKAVGLFRHFVGGLQQIVLDSCVRRFPFRDERVLSVQGAGDRGGENQQ